MTMVSPWMVRPPTVADAFSSTGLSRTVTVELLLIDSSRVLSMAAARMSPQEPTNVTQKRWPVATLLYSPAAWDPHGHERAPSRRRRRLLRLQPARKNGRRRGLAGGPPRPHPGPARTQRLRQDDAAPTAIGHDRAHPRADHPRRPGARQFL